MAASERAAAPRGAARPLVVILAFAAATVVPGCIADDEDVSAPVVLRYSGDENGSHSDKLVCGNEISVAGAGEVTSGWVNVRVLDGRGNATFDHLYEQDFRLEGRRLEGLPGNWTLTAERSGGFVLDRTFDGSYEFALGCIS